MPVQTNQGMLSPRSANTDLDSGNDLAIVKEAAKRAGRWNADRWLPKRLKLEIDKSESLVRTAKDAFVDPCRISFETTFHRWPKVPDEIWVYTDPRGQEVGNGAPLETIGRKRSNIGNRELDDRKHRE